MGVLEKFTPKEVEETEEFNVEARISDHNKCRDVKKLKQNEKFNVCVYATPPLIKISDILTMTMVQSNGGTEVVEDLVTGGKPNLFSTKISQIKVVLSIKNGTMEQLYLLLLLQNFL